MATLSQCRTELYSIIRELRDIEWGIRRDFVNIGEDLCGNCISKVTDKYQYKVLRDLNNVNTNKFADWVTGNN